jgi:hypothetical protein
MNSIEFISVPAVHNLGRSLNDKNNTFIRGLYTGLAALTLLVAESNLKQKDTLIIDQTNNESTSQMNTGKPVIWGVLQIQIKKRNGIKVKSIQIPN